MTQQGALPLGLFRSLCQRKLTTEQLQVFVVALRTTYAWLLHGTGAVDPPKQETRKEEDHLREENANLRGQLEVSRGLVVFLKEMIRDLVSTSRGGG